MKTCVKCQTPQRKHDDPHKNHPGLKAIQTPPMSTAPLAETHLRCHSMLTSIDTFLKEKSLILRIPWDRYRENDQPQYYKENQPKLFSRRILRQTDHLWCIVIRRKHSGNNSSELMNLLSSAQKTYFP